MTGSVIQESIKNSQEKYRNVRAKTKEYSDCLKQGRKFFHDNLEFFDVQIEDLKIDIGYRILDENIEYAYSVCSEKDKYSRRIGKANIGNIFLSGKQLSIYNVRKCDKESLRLFFISDLLLIASELFSSPVSGIGQKIKKHINGYHFTSY